MKRQMIALLLAAALILGGCTTPAFSSAANGSAVSQSSAAAPSVPASAATSLYQDGVYEVETAPDAERYYVKGTVTIQGGRIASVECAIFDAARSDKLFDKDYEAVFDNATYKQQCRDNLAGMAGYASQLIDTQSMDGVDVVTGATWAHKKFGEWVGKALAQAAAK